MVIVARQYTRGEDDAHDERARRRRRAALRRHGPLRAAAATAARLQDAACRSRPKSQVRERRALQEVESRERGMFVATGK